MDAKELFKKAEKLVNDNKDTIEKVSKEVPGVVEKIKKDGIGGLFKK